MAASAGSERTDKEGEGITARGRRRTAGLAALFAVLFVVSGALLVRDLAEARRQEQEFAGLRELIAGKESADETRPVGVKSAGEAKPAGVKSADETRPASAESAGAPARRDEVRLAGLAELARQNPDFAGWVCIAGTAVDYPVMYAPDRPDYYLHRDFCGKQSSAGTPYLDEFCDPDEQGGSLLAYGHHMKDGRMFAGLTEYTSRDYFLAHQQIRFDTPRELCTYEIAAVAAARADGDDLPWQELLFPAEEAEFDRAWERFRQRRLYDTGVELVAADALLALVTCEYTQENGRLIVVARRVEKER